MRSVVASLLCLAGVVSGTRAHLKLVSFNETTWIVGRLLSGRLKLLLWVKLSEKIKTITNYVYKLVAVDKINKIIIGYIKYSKFSEA